MPSGPRNVIAIATLLWSHWAFSAPQTQLPGNAVERHLPGDRDFTQFVHNPDLLADSTGDDVVLVEVSRDTADTVKLRGVVPAVHFASGIAQIPASTVRELQVVLDSLRDRHNVRLHLVGHADTQPLSAALARVYENNAGLSRERAGEVAEFFYAALSLPAQSISYEWAGDTQPVASNDSAQGRAQNRRVEVEVWYDEVAQQTAQKEEVVVNDVQRVKVCRIQTLCKMRYVDGHDKRARVQNVIPPLRYEAQSLEVDEAFIETVKRAWANLSDRSNVVMKFIGHTDNAELDERNARIYGDHDALSRARAWRVALAVRESLQLPSSAIAVDGSGFSQPLASNHAADGRALNRRVAVEFWYDDPLQELPNEPRLCPGEAVSVTVTKVHTPSNGMLADLRLEGGRIEVPPGYVLGVQQALDEIAGRQRARVRVVGYTANATLDRRTAGIYEDDVGLATARARRAAETLKIEAGLSARQIEFEGRGFVHADDVVNAGFVQGPTSHIAVQVVYDESVLPDDLQGTEISPLRQELTPENPFALNLMRITVDGEPIDDQGRSSADVQRCTDVALQDAEMSFAFDNLRSERRLSVDAEPSRVLIDSVQQILVDPVQFRMHANYLYFIERAEVRLFKADQSLRGDPLAVLPVDAEGLAVWAPESGSDQAVTGNIQYVLRAYGADGNFDETRPYLLQVGRRQATAEPGMLLAGYGVNAIARQNIRLGSGTVRVAGQDIPDGHQVWVAGQAVPVDGAGRFVSEQILPKGMHTVEVAVLDKDGNGELFLRDLSFEAQDWFYVGMADFTLSESSVDGPAELLQGDNSNQDIDSNTHGRIAFFANGKFGDQWRLTTSVDTRDEPLDQMFTNIVDKTPESLFRRIDPDYHYPTYGDDSTVDEMAPTSGKVYLKVSRGDSHAMWGNVGIRYDDNELARVDRGIYGANTRFQSSGTTSFGERNLVIDGFAAEPGTVPARQEFRGTGGSLYFLRHQDLLAGSERVRVEFRDSISGLVNASRELRPGLDYTLDNLQGTILLSEPLASTASNTLLIRDGSVSGDEAHLVIRYEYTPGFDDIDALSTGAQGHFWVTDYLQVGLTSSMNELDGEDNNLHGGNLTLRKTANTWVKVQGARSEGLVSDTLHSVDGGFVFESMDTGLFRDADAAAYRMDVSVGFDELVDWGRGRLTMYTQHTEAGYSAPGLAALTDTDHFGATLAMPITQAIELGVRSEQREQDLGLMQQVHEVDVSYRMNAHWIAKMGLRQDTREDENTAIVLTQEIGERTDAILHVGYDATADWDAYLFAQNTLSKSESREGNSRYGVGGGYQVNDQIRFEGEVSGGEQGMGGRAGTRYTFSPRTSMYLNYALESERTDNVFLSQRGRQGTLVGGMRTRLSDSTSVYTEHRYRSGRSLTGLTHATGVNLTPVPGWNLGLSSDIGTLRDRTTGAETERRAAGANASYKLGLMSLSAGIEYRRDISEQLDLALITRQTWLYRSSFKLDTSPSTRVLGKFNHAVSDSSLGAFHDGGFTEGSVGYAYRPIHHDRLNTLVKYTYVYNIPTTDQVTLRNLPVEYIQKSHVASVDATYDITTRWSLGAKFAQRLGEISLDREDRKFFGNNARLYLVRTDYRLFRNWEVLLEARRLDMTDLGDSRSGALVALSRYLGDHLKLGLGYNFTDFSDDLTDLSFEHRGAFLNVTGVL